MLGGDLQGDRPEHVDDEQVGRAGGVDGVEPGVGEEFEEPFVEGERMWPVHRPAENQGDGAGVRRQPLPQLQGQRLHPQPPRLGPVGEDVVVDLSEQALDDRLDHGGLVQEVGVYRVRGHPDPGGDAPHGRRGRPAVVEQAQRGVEDLVLGLRGPSAGRGDRV